MSFSHEQSTSLAQVPLWLLVELANELSTATNLETLQRILARKLRCKNFPSLKGGVEKRSPNLNRILSQT